MEQLQPFAPEEALLQVPTELSRASFEAEGTSLPTEVPADTVDAHTAALLRVWKSPEDHAWAFRYNNRHGQ